MEGETEISSVDLEGRVRQEHLPFSSPRRACCFSWAGFNMPFPHRILSSCILLKVAARDQVTPSTLWKKHFNLISQNFIFHVIVGNTVAKLAAIPAPLPVVANVRFLSSFRTLTRSVPKSRFTLTTSSEKSWQFILLAINQLRKQIWISQNMISNSSNRCALLGPDQSGTQTCIYSLFSSHHLKPTIECN